MPRAHTEVERQRIQQRLIDDGRARFIRHGLSKTTVADLARDAGIGKGSFYAFFASKEELFLAIQERDEAEFKRTLSGEFDAAASGRAAVSLLLRASAERLDRQPFLRMILDPEVLRAVLLRVEPERLEAHRQADHDFFTQLASDWHARGWLRRSVSPQTFFDVLAAMFVLSTGRDLLGADASRRANNALVDAVVDAWVP